MDLVEALTQAAIRDADGQSVQELSEQTGLTIERVRAKLRVLQREGRLELSGRKLRLGIDGRTVGVPAYRIKG